MCCYAEILLSCFIILETLNLGDIVNLNTYLLQM